MDSKTNWTPILEMDDEDGNHTSYSTKIEGKFFWITQMPDNTWSVETQDEVGDIYPIKASLKSLTSAKRYFTTYIKPNIERFTGDVYNES